MKKKPNKEGSVYLSGKSIEYTLCPQFSQLIFPQKWLQLAAP